jgi:hypothetical protein
MGEKLKPSNFEYFKDQDQTFLAEDIWGNEVLVIGKTNTIVKCRGQNIGEGFIVINQRNEEVVIHPKAIKKKL